MEFISWGKTPRLLKDCVITEKIDGTNACVIVEEAPETFYFFDKLPEDVIEFVFWEGKGYFIGAQSKNRLITPDKDNAGFARWVDEHAYQLVATLGVGHHFGEWWGSGIQRAYGLTNGEKVFSLFNTKRWADSDALSAVQGLEVVPVLGIGTFNGGYIADVFEELKRNGSYVSPGFMNPEGIVVFHTASRQLYKMTYESDGGKWMEAA